MTSTADANGTATGSPAVSRGSKGLGLFRAFWRWHFYASILVIPVLALLSITGLTWLWRFELEPALHPGLMTVSASSATTPYSTQQAAAEAAFPGWTATAMTEPWANRATVFTMAPGDGQKRLVFVNPHDSEVLGSLEPSDLLSEKAIRLHGELMSGRFGDAIIELAACWAIVMTLTGYFMFAAGRKARRRRRKSSAPAVRLRSRHAAVGSLVGLGILFLTLSGMPWTGVWGDAVQKIATGRGTTLWADDPGAESDLAQKLSRQSGTQAPAPWALGQSGVPASSPPRFANGSISVDAAIRAAALTGIPRPYTVTFPEGRSGVFSVMADSSNIAGNPAFKDVSKEAVVHVDQYSGAVAAEYGYSQYSPAARVVLQSVALHEGRRFGTLNKLTSTAFCLGVLFLCVSGPLMWWKRRPSGSGLAAPRAKLPIRTAPSIGVLLVGLGLFFPLFGVSLALILVVDQLLIRRIPQLRELFGSAEPGSLGTARTDPGDVILPTSGPTDAGYVQGAITLPTPARADEQRV